MTRLKIACPLAAVLALVMVLPLAAQPARATNPNVEKSVNLALHKRVTASSSLEQPGWTAAMVVDGERDEKPGARGWQSGGDTSRNHTEWLEIDLGGSYSLGQIDLYPRNDPARLGEGFPIDFSMEVSADGRTWTTVSRNAGYAKPGDKVQSFTFNPVSGRYVRITGTNLRYLGAESAYYMQFAEVEVFAAVAAAAPTAPESTWNPALAGTSWQGEIQLSDGRTRSFTATVDGSNRISGEVALSIGGSTAKIAIQGTYDPGTGAITLKYGGTRALGAEQATLNGTASSPTAAAGQGTVAVTSVGRRQSLQATWRMSR